MNFKVLAVGFDCTGQCNTTSSTPFTGALDFGGQYIFTRDSLVTVGLSVRNIGLPLQVNDSPQSDALPRRLDFGLAYSPRFADYPDARLTVAADFVSRLGEGGGSGFRFGSEVSWLNQYYGRAGYVVTGPNSSGRRSASVSRAVGGTPTSRSSSPTSAARTDRANVLHAEVRLPMRRMVCWCVALSFAGVGRGGAQGLDAGPRRGRVAGAGGVTHGRGWRLDSASAFSGAVRCSNASRIAPIASASIPGSGQLMLGQNRTIAAISRSKR